MSSPKSKGEPIQHIVELTDGRMFTTAHHFKIHKHPDHPHKHEVSFMITGQKAAMRVKEIDIRRIAPPLLEGEAMTDHLRSRGSKTGAMKKTTAHKK